MKKAIRSSLALACAGLVAAGSPLYAQPQPESAESASSPNDRSADDSEASSGDFYCGDRKLGIWFYCEKPKPRPSEKKTPAPSATAASERLASISKELDELKARAILEPSEENVTAYIRFQREQLDRASMFSDVWQRSMWQNPDLDYTLQRPVTTLAKRAWIDNRKAEQEMALRNLSKRYGIFYFYAQSCGACDIFAPILRSLADGSGFNVVAVSMDGGPNRVFPNYVVDVGQHAKMGLSSKATPALVLYDTVRKRPILIGTGILSADEITERIFTLTSTKAGSDF